MSHYNLLLSVILFLLSICIFFYKRIYSSKPLRVLFGFGVFMSILFYTFYGVANYFTGNGITNAVVYYIQYGLNGAGFSEYLGLILISTLSILLGGIFFILVLFRKRSQEKHAQIYFILFLLLLSLFFNPVTTSIKDFVLENNQEFDKGSDFYQYYHYPEIEQIGEAKNLVFIYGEGLERTYFNEDLFPDLIKNLREIESKSISFTNIEHDTDYSHHTMAGMVASQCGFPLISLSHPISMSGMDTYLESATCLGDLLYKEGYYLGYYGGADLNFAGKGKFYSTHKFNDIKGKNTLLPKLKNQDYKTGWGLYDDSLFDLAYNNFVKLSQEQDKFAMFLLTLDTHHPRGYPSKSCEDINYGDGSNTMLNAVACSDYLIADFIEKIRQSKYSDKTVIVIVSDHLAMPNTATDLLDKVDRENLFLINTPDSLKGFKNHNQGLTFDIGSTILPFIGYRGDIGFGRDVINLEGQDSRIKNILNNLDKFKPEILQFWGFPTITKSIKIDIKDKGVSLDNRKFRIPILIELNNQLETSLKFEFNLPEKMELSSHILKMDESKYFIWIDKCNKINKIANTNIEYSDFCLLSGKGGKYNIPAKLTSNIHYSKKEIKKIIENLKKSSKLNQNHFLVKRIAHAGGSINRETYTNSIDALNKSIENGFIYFEIDFVFTKDNHLVCLHDWGSNFEKRFGFKIDHKLTLEEFKRVVNERSNLHICTLSELAKWMDKNPDSCLVTDIKENNIEALKIISDTIHDFEKRVIPQIYSPEEFDKVKKIGYDQVIWTLYKHDKADDEVLNAIKEFNGSFAITIPKERAKSSLPKKLDKIDIPTYTHTINSIEKKDEFLKKYNITGIYTDFLDP